MRFFAAVTLLCFFTLGLAVAQAPGDYDGQWTSDQSGDSGKFHCSLKKSGDSWDSSAYFVYQGEKIIGSPKSTKVDGSKLEMVFEYEIGGMTLHSVMTGEWTGNTLEGKYASKSSDESPVDTGTWKVTRPE